LRSNNTPLARRYVFAGLVVGITLMLCAVAEGIIAVAALVITANGPRRIHEVYLINPCQAISTLAMGLSAVMVWLFSRTLRPIKATTLSMPSADSIDTVPHVLGIANVTVWQVISALILAALTAIASLDLLGPMAQYLAGWIALALVIIVFGTEILIDIRPSRLSSAGANAGHALKILRNIRIGVFGAFLAMAGLEFITPYQLLERLGILILATVFVLYVGVTHRMLVRLRSILRDIESPPVNWYEPHGAAAFGGLTLLYHVLMNAGRSFPAGPTEVITNIKGLVGYMMNAVAIWALAALVLNALRLRREATVRVASMPIASTPIAS